MAAIQLRDKVNSVVDLGGFMIANAEHTDAFTRTTTIFVGLFGRTKREYTEQIPESNELRLITYDSNSWRFRYASKEDLDFDLDKVKRILVDEQQ